MSDLKEPLLDKSGENSDFGISRDELMELFEKENRTSDEGGVCESRKRLKKLGNAEGLLKALDSNLDKGIKDSKDEMEKRDQAFGNNHRRKVSTRGI